MDLLSRGFSPMDGMKTSKGLVLRLNPSINEDPEIKFAPFSDKRIVDPTHYLKFQRFLPQEIELVSPPIEGWNSFGFVLGRSDSLNVSEFRDLTKDYQFQHKKLEVNDVVIYLGWDDGWCPEFLHAGIYLGDERVRSVWVDGGPVVEHPIKEVLPPHYRPPLEVYWDHLRMSA